MQTKGRKFTYHDWLPILELDGRGGAGTGVSPVIRAYTWGLDLVGQMGSAGVSPADVTSGPRTGRPGVAGHGGPALQGAGGVGGLLAVHQSQTGGGLDAADYVYFYDATGPNL